MRENLIEQNKLLARVAAQSIEAGYLAKHLPFETLRQITESEDILFLWVVKPDGEIYLSDDPRMWGKKINDSSIGTKEIVIKEGTFFQTGEKITLFVYPLDIGEPEKRWTLYLGVSPKSLITHINKMIIVSISFFIILIIFATIVSVYLARSVTKPITELRDVTDKISKGNLDIKAEIKSRDEIGQLASAFNKMTEDLKKSREELKQYSKQLEREVEKRTKQLQLKIKEAEGSKAATLNIMEDVDETNKRLLEAQEKLKKYVKELKLLDIKKDEFISITAHELKTPLTSIRGFVDLLQREEVAANPTTRSNYLQIIHQDTERLGTLITDILDLSKLDLGTMKFNYEKTDFNEIMDEIRRQMYPIIEKKKLTPYYEIRKNIPPIITDKGRLIQVISNIINNAVKYTSEGGKIFVTAQPEKENILITIKDTGIGIPKEHIEKIFSRFYQVDSSYTRKMGGSGLGLAICKGIVEAMGGKIWAESKVGKGSTFYILLPTEPKKKEKYASVIK
jgi:signal transduction histidine kinase